MTGRHLLGALAVLLAGAGCGQVFVCAPRESALKTYLQGLLYEQAGEPAEAMARYREALRANPESSQAWLRLGNLLLKEKRVPEARAALERSVRLDPKNVEALSGLMALAVQRERPNEAIAYGERVLEAAPDQVQVRMLLCDLYKATGRLNESLNHQEYLLEALPTGHRYYPSILFNAALVRLAMGRTAAAEAGFRRLIGMLPRFEKAHIALVQLLERAGRTAEAVEAARAAVAAAPGEPGLYYLLANTLLRANRQDEARTVLEAAIAKGLEQKEFYNILGAIALDAREYERAEAAFRKSVAIEDASPVRFYLGIVCDKLGKKAAMEEEMLRAVKLDPDNAAALNYLGYSWVVEEKNLDKAMEMIARACKLEPESGAYIDSLGWAHYKKKNLRLARKYLEQAVRLEEDAEILEHLGWVCFDGGDYEQAVLWLSKSLERAKNPAVEKKLREALRRLR